MAGHGSHITHGAGFPFIMAVGIMTITTAGSGFPEPSGDLPGLHGGGPMVTMAGLLSGRALLSMLPLDITTICPMTDGSLFVIMTLTGPTYTAITYIIQCAEPSMEHPG